MVYRGYVGTVRQGNTVGWTFTFYNHQDFMVYKKSGKCEAGCEKEVILQTAVTAVKYFDSSMRRRYYDEHFSTRIDEDYVTLFTEMPEIAAAAEKYKSAGMIGFTDEDMRLWEALVPFFAQKTMSFETAADERFITAAKELAAKQFAV